jgi:hypothetical protein
MRAQGRAPIARGYGDRTQPIDGRSKNLKNHLPGALFDVLRSLAVWSGLNRDDFASGVETFHRSLECGGVIIRNAQQ